MCMIQHPVLFSSKRSLLLHFLFVLVIYCLFTTGEILRGHYLFVCHSCVVYGIAVGQQFNKQIALRSHLNLIIWPPDTTHNHKYMCTHSPGIHAHIHKGAHTQKLNHIIATQIINDIIFGYSIYNAGQLDARSNKEGVRERDRTGEQEQRKHV